MKTIVGTRPTGRLHIGHYASVIKPALDDPDVDVMIARYHAPGGDHFGMQQQLSRFGVTNIKLQDFNPELFSTLLAVTPSHLLKAMPQYKATSDKSALMYIYPVLMAHDVAGYDRVLVGDDQRPHIELARDILPRVGVTPPEALYSGGRVMDLRHPERKMSKSEPTSCLFLDDSDYKHKIQKAVTTPEGRRNLEAIFDLLGGTVPPASNSELKEQLVALYESHFVE